MMNTKFVKYQDSALLMIFNFASDCEGTPIDMSDITLTLKVYDVLNNEVAAVNYLPTDALNGFYQMVFTNNVPLGDLRFTLTAKNLVTDRAVLFSENNPIRKSAVNVNYTSGALYNFGTADNAAPFYSGIILHLKR